MSEYDLPKKATLTAGQSAAMEIARIGAMSQAPFFQHFYYSVMEDYPTYDIPTLATNSKKLFFNPEYLAGLEDSQRIFAWVHEIFHAVDRHPQRIGYYLNQGTLRGLPFVEGHGNELFNIYADYVINATLIETKVGSINPSWLYDPAIGSKDFVEDLWVKHFTQPPPQPQGGGKPGGEENKKGGGGLTPQPPTGRPGQSQPNKTAGDNGKRGRPDKIAEAQGGRFDKVVKPHRDLATGKEDQVSEAEFKEAITKAAVQARAIGKMPGAIERMVQEILAPQVSWREHVRTLLTGRLGSRRESWSRPNRRRLVLNPIVFMPGHTRFGCKTVVTVIDNSGSIRDKEYDAFFAEIGGLLQEVRPREIVVIWCDATVRRVESVRSLDDIRHLRVSKTPGGGGTSFRPPFDYLRKEQIVPDTLIYLTDLEGGFPSKPNYPVVWCSTTPKKAPFGETVHIVV